jgi:hypothetical protein
LRESSGSLILLAYAGVIFYLNGRRNPGRSREALMAARLRATVWATIGIAILSASFNVYLITDISLVAILSAMDVEGPAPMTSGWTPRPR